MVSKEDNDLIKKEMDVAISKLEEMGLDPNAHKNETIEGLGDVIEYALQSVGITEDRFKAWFNLKECNCSKRKAYLNNLFSWKKNKE